MGIKAQNQITIVDLTDGYSVMLSADYVSLDADTTSLGESKTLTTIVSAFKGAMQITPSIDQSSIVCPTYVSVEVGEEESNTIPITFTFDARLGGGGIVRIPVSLEDGTITITKIFSYSLSFTGRTGDPGTPGEEGPQGEDGEDGISVVSIQPQYRLSTSPSSLSGGSWSLDLEYVSGYYIWTREMITFSDGVVDYSEPIYDQALTEACSLSYNTAQYFWVNDSGTTSVPTGAYVTEIPKDTYKSNPRYGALLMRSGGIFIRVGSKTVAEFQGSGMSLYDTNSYKLAEFLSTGVLLYYQGNKRLEINTNGLSLYDANSYKLAEFISTGVLLYYQGKKRLDVNTNGLSLYDTVNGTDTVVATFKKDKIELGKNASFTTLDFGNSTMTIDVIDNPSYGEHGARFTVDQTYSSSSSTTTYSTIDLMVKNKYSSTTKQASVNLSASGKNGTSGAGMLADTVTLSGATEVVFATPKVSAVGQLYLNQKVHPEYSIGTISWTQPTFYNSRASFVSGSGGFYQIGRKVIVNFKCTWAENTGSSSAGNEYGIVTNLPTPLLQSALTCLNLTKNCPIGAMVMTSGTVMRIEWRAGEMANGDILLVSGSYIASSSS